jgi:phosphoribosylanthranilate isomerase
MVKVKICGITNIEDALYSCKAGADLLGFVFVSGTKRAVTPEKAKDIIGGLPCGVCDKVGLFKDEALDKVSECAVFCGLDHVQLHGDESPLYCAGLKRSLNAKGSKARIIKTFKIGAPGAPASFENDLYPEAEIYLFDTFHAVLPGGTGDVFDWEILRRTKIGKPFFLAGGLTPENVARAVLTAKPYGVDVSSGVEASPGKKDLRKIKEFIDNAKSPKNT